MGFINQLITGGPHIVANSKAVMVGSDPDKGQDLAKTSVGDLLAKKNLLTLTGGLMGNPL